MYEKTRKTRVFFVLGILIVANKHLDYLSMSMLQMITGGADDDPEENLTTSVESDPSLMDMFPAIARMRELRSPTIMLRMESVMEIR